MQQFKLVAGLQAMYSMLLAANSWPGARLTEQQGKALVHDILDRLGLLDPKEDTEILSEMDGDNSDHPSSPDEVSSVASSPRSRSEIGQVSGPPCGGSPASPQDFAPQQNILPESNGPRPSLDTWKSQPIRPDFQPHLPIKLSSDFELKPPPKMIAALSSTSPPTESVGATAWDVFDCLTYWWEDDVQTLAETSFPNIGLTSADPSQQMATNMIDPSAIAIHDQNAYLTDPGIYACDFDVV